MKVKLNKEKLDKLSPEDAIPLLIRLRKLVLGSKRPDVFTRVVFSLNLFSWILFFSWNSISYVVLIMSNVIKENKGFSVNAIIRRKGRDLGFEGQDFLETITSFFLLQHFVWVIIFVGIILMYRKLRLYVLIYLGGFSIHFFMMFWMLGLQYFIEDISSFDKVLYGVMLLSVFLHSLLLNKENKA